MTNIIALFHCLYPYLTRTTIRQLSRIIIATLAMTGRVTMLGISRWTGGRTLSYCATFFLHGHSLGVGVLGAHSSAFAQS